MPDERRHVALIGMAGVGKTVVGSRLARRLGTAWVDLDRSVETRAGCSVAEVFASLGEVAFRELETLALEDTLAAERPTVISTGGGAVLATANAAMLHDRSLTVWLRAREDTIVNRLSRSRTVRPLLAGDLSINVAALLAERTPRYEACADVVVDVDSMSVARCVQWLVAELAAHSAVPSPGSSS